MVWLVMVATGERIQIVLPPAVEQGYVSITLRKPSTTIYTLEDFEQQGLFRNVEVICDDPGEFTGKFSLDEHEQVLMQLLLGGRIKEFLCQAVRRKRNIVVSGATGSGKTTFMKGVIQECPIDEHLITIEDAREIFLPRHPHKTHLLYSKGEQGLAKVTAQKLLVSCLRMKPDRILLAEIREGECYDFLRTAASGHPGSITSMHAGTCAEAFEQMGLMIRQSEAGSGLSHTETQRLLRLLVDVVVQYVKDSGGRRVSQIYYRPLRKKELAHG
jgi:type IV secretion system protein VirB11